MIIERFFGKKPATQTQPVTTADTKHTRRAKEVSAGKLAPAPRIEATDASASLIRAGDAPAASAPDGPVPVAPRQTPYEDVAVRAYELWISQGRPEGRDRENWDEAERQLALERSRG